MNLIKSNAHMNKRTLDELYKSNHHEKRTHIKPIDVIAPDHTLAATKEFVTN